MQWTTREVLNHRGKVPQDPLDAIDVKVLLLHYKWLFQLECCWIRLAEHLRWPAGQLTDRQASTTQTMRVATSLVLAAEHGLLHGLLQQAG